MFHQNQMRHQVIWKQPYSSANWYPNYRESGWDDGGFANKGGGFILPLIAGGITGAILAGSLNQNQQSYPTQGYPAQNYPAQGYAAQSYPVQNYPIPVPVPYYQPQPMNTQQTSSPSQNIIQTNTVHYPTMPSIQNMPEDNTMIQKQGKAYVTNPLTPSQQLTSLMPYYMFSMRF